MKNIYLILLVGFITSCFNSNESESNKKTDSKKQTQIIKEPVVAVEAELDLTPDSSFEGAVYTCMKQGLSDDGIDLNSDLTAFHKILIDLKWLKGNTGIDYYNLLQSQVSYEPEFNTIPKGATVFANYYQSGPRMSDCKLTLVSERNEAYKTSKMFSLDNIQSGYRSEGGSVYLQLLDIYKNELTAEDLDQPYYKFSVQYIIYLFWSQKVEILEDTLPVK